VALQQKSEKAVTVLLEYGQGSKVKLPALHIAAKKDDVSAVKLLLRSETADQESMVSCWLLPPHTCFLEDTAFAF